MDNKENSQTAVCNSPKLKSKVKGNLFSSFGSPSNKKSSPFNIISDNDIAILASKKLGAGNPVKTAKRRSLATLQPSALGNGSLSGNGRDGTIENLFSKGKKSSKNSTPQSVTKTPLTSTKEERDTKSISIKDSGKLTPKEPSNTTTPLLTPVNTTKSTDKATDDPVVGDDKDLIEDALALMRSTEEVTDSYWKKLAEERRLALEETLKENDSLYDEIDLLKEENQKLKDAADDAAYFKLMYENLLAEKED